MRTRTDRARPARVPGDRLTPRERAFCLAYLSNGFHAALAYHAISPEAVAATSATEGPAYLRKPHVKAYVNRQVAKHFRTLKVSGREILGRVAQDARSDIRELFDDHGQLLPPQQWPASIANSIESFELTKDGWRVRFVSKLHARRILLEITGQLHSPVAEEVSVLARALRGDLARSDPGPDAVH